MQGAKNLYRRLIHQRLVDNEVVIDDLLSNTGQVGIGIDEKSIYWCHELCIIGNNECC